MRYLIALVALMLSSLPALADVVVLNNGDRMTGTVDSVAGGRVLLMTDYAGAVPIKVDAIVELITEQAFDVSVDGEQRNGQFDVIDGVQVLTTDSGSQPVTLAEVNRAGQNKLSLRRLVPEWTARATLAANISNGNSDTENYSTLVEAGLKQEAVEHSISLLITDETSEDVQVKEELDLDYGYKRFVSEKWYASGNAEYFKDPIKDVDRRITLGAGMGYQFWDDSFGSLSTDLTLNYVREELQDDDETNPAVRWGLEYKRFLFSKKLEAFHKQSVLFIPDSDRGEVLESSTGLRFALNSKIDATARVDVDHETEPEPGNSKTDITYNLGVGIKF